MNFELERDTLSDLQSGSSEAFEKLFHWYGGKLYNFILKLSSGDTYLSEEIVQRTFVRIWEIRSTVNPDKSFISFLCTIAKNMLMNEYEHQTVEYIYREYVLKYYSNSDEATEGEINKNLLEEYIDKLVDKLPPARRKIFIMSRKEMYSNKEIAIQLQISESTVQNQLSKAISFMKEQLAKYYDHILYLIVFFTFVN